MTSDTEYMVNPDVSCRIEDQEGAILYNPDTDSVQIINPIGLEIWETLSDPHTLLALTQHLVSLYEGASPSEIENDARDFVNQMVAKGFIGTVAPDDSLIAGDADRGC